MLKHSWKLNGFARGGEDTHAKWSGKCIQRLLSTHLVSLSRCRGAFFRGKANCFALLFDDMQRKILYLLAHKEQIQTFAGRAKRTILCLLNCSMIATRKRIESEMKSALWRESKSQRQSGDSSPASDDERGMRSKTFLNFLLSTSCWSGKNFPPPTTSHNSQTHPDPQPSPHPLRPLENKSLAGEFNNIYCIRAIRLVLREKGKALTQLFMKRDERMLKY